jgi:hypothetical protein
MSDLDILKRTILAPWIFKGTALIGKPRKLGGNQFRHNMATMAILIDYHLVDPVLLKASVIHDLLEEIPDTDINDLLKVDDDSPAVVKLVQEVTKTKNEPKEIYLGRLRESGSDKAKILKCADRISNVTDLHYGIYQLPEMYSYLDQTEKYVVPLADEVNHDMFIELTDLISNRRKMLKKIELLEAYTDKILIDNTH